MYSLWQRPVDLKPFFKITDLKEETLTINTALTFVWQEVRTTCRNMFSFLRYCVAEGGKCTLAESLRHIVNSTTLEQSFFGRHV